MQEQTGRMEPMTEIEKEFKKENIDARRSMRGKWVEIADAKDAEKVRPMNRKQRRAWLAEQRRLRRNFNEVEIP